MEPQETFCCYDNTKRKCDRKRNCLGIVAIILLTAFAVVIGLLVGAAVAAAILAALPAVIVLAVILGLLLILTLILILCNRKRDCKERKCC
jgi:undecaprenyl pyrophosphate phosphatase UppP